MKIMVTGANGMLGKDLVKILNQQGFCVIPTDIDELDITDNESVKNFLTQDNFDFVIHLAAYTDVDGAESNENKAILINHAATENLAKCTAKLNIPMLYISTDYVFNGKKGSPYEINDATDPINIYGKSKLMGEESVKNHNPQHYIVRTSWLYGHYGKNFIETIINLAAKNQELRVVNDQIGCPTWTIELSYAIIDLIKNKKPYGIFHICGSGYTSWHGFAVRIIELMKLKTKVIPVATEEFPRPAKRPEYSVMNNNNTCCKWEESLIKYIELREK